VKFDILNRWSGQVIFTADINCADDESYSVKLGLAVKCAVEARAYLADANLAGANLADANLAGAYLADANLADAKGIAKELSTPLTMLLDQPGKIRAYKLVNEDGTGPTYSGINYEIGAEIEEKDACTDETQDCAAGINVATLDWCLRGWQPGYRILIVEFEAKDIACIPLGTDGKFRLFRCKVIEEKKLDYEALGLVKKQKEAA
jgi:hypothetical protein